MNRWSNALGSVGGVAGAALALALSAAVVAPGAVWAGSHLKAQDKTAPSGTVQKKLQSDKKAPSGPATSGAVLGGQPANKDCEKLKTTDKKCPNSTTRIGAGTPGGGPAFDPRVQGQGGPQNQGGSFTKEHGGGGSSVKERSQSPGLVDPRGTGDKAKEKPKGSFDDLSKQGQLDKLRTGVEDKVKGQSENAGVVIGPDGKATGGKLGDRSAPGGIPMRLEPGAGKPKVSKQEQQSNEYGGKTYSGTSLKGTYHWLLKRDVNGTVRETKTIDDLTGREVTTFHDEKGAKVRTEDRDANTGSRVIESEKPSPSKPKPDPKTSRPDDEGGRGTVSECKRDAVTGRCLTQTELDAQRKRQVTLPDGEKGGKPDRADLEKTSMSPEEKRQRMRDGMTGGTINPGPDGSASGETTSTGSGPLKVGAGRGLERAGGAVGTLPGQPGLGVRPPGGSDPDNPTMSTGSSSSSGTGGDSRSTR